MLASTSRRAFVSVSSTATKAYSTAAAAQISTAQNGIKVAAIEEPGQTAGLAVVVNGGSRFEPVQGVAHYLKNYGFKVGHSASYWTAFVCGATNDHPGFA